MSYTIVRLVPPSYILESPRYNVAPCIYHRVFYGVGKRYYYVSIPKISYNFSSIFLINKYLFIYIFLCFVIWVPYYVKPSIVLSIHIFDSTTSATSLIIQNNNLFTTANTTQGTSTVQGSVTTSTTVPGTSETISYSDGSFADNKPSVHEQVTSSSDRIMIFRTAGVNHTFTIPSGGLNCDILMIGGGGANDGNAGGAGAGACIVAINHTLPAGSCIVNVGIGGTWRYNGGQSFISVGGTMKYLANGGGATGGNTANTAGVAGGCGGGASYNSDSTTENGGAAVSTNVVNGSLANIGPSITSTYAVMGNAGGNNAGSTNAGSGGGIGSAGVSADTGGNGAYQVTLTGAATPINFRNHFANGSTSFGVQHGTTGNYYIGGGGGGFNGSNRGTQSGGLGGGGGVLGGGGGNGYSNTGGGAGAAYSNGGSGIIIIRYRNSTIPLPTITPATPETTTTTTTTTYTHTTALTTTLSTPTLGTPSIELVRGTQGDSNRDYKIGNYDGDFIVKSSANGVDTDYLRISSTGAITNPTGTASWNTGSDRRIKENIERASYDKCYDNISRLELNRFNYIKGFNSVNRDITQLGFIAQEVYDIFPKAISTNGYYSDTLSIPDLLSIDVTQINYSLYGAVKKLIEINNNKELRLKKLESILNIECDSSNVAIIDDTITSNIVIEEAMTSNIVIEGAMTSNV